MKMRQNIACRNMTHIFFWSTVCSTFLFATLIEIGMTLLPVGAESIFISFVYAAFGENQILGYFCRLWFLAFSILLILIYILTLWKGWFRAFFILTCADTVFSFVMAFGSLLEENTYGFAVILGYGVISLVFCGFYGYFLFKRKVPSESVE